MPLEWTTTIGKESSLAKMMSTEPVRDRGSSQSGNPHLDCTVDSPLCQKPKREEIDHLKQQIKRIDEGHQHIVLLDNNATHPVLPEVIEAVSYASRIGGNASCPHISGRRARTMLEECRAEIASFLGVDDTSMLIFTSGGTEANNMFMIGMALRRITQGRNEIVVSAVEHKSVLNAAKHLKHFGGKVIVLPVDGNGLVDPDVLAKSVSKRTALVSIIHVNNETGVIMPVEDYCHIVKAKDKDILFHSDMSQTLTKAPVPRHAYIDGMSFSGHKFGGPIGIGILILRRTDGMLPVFYGGNQEGGFRPGTYNVPLIFGLNQAVRMVNRVNQDKVSEVRLHLETEMIKLGCFVHGISVPRASNTSSITVPKTDNKTLIAELSEQGFCVAGGSACDSFDPEPSHVLRAMGLSDEDALATLRTSIGRMTSTDSVNAFVTAFKKITGSAT